MATQPTSAVRSDAEAPGSAHPARRWWALIAIAASVLVVGLDLTVLNLALPNIAVSLHASTGDLQWFSDAYSLVIAAMILPAVCPGRPLRAQAGAAGGAGAVRRGLGVVRVRDLDR